MFIVLNRNQNFKNCKPENHSQKSLSNANVNHQNAKNSKKKSIY